MSLGYAEKLSYIEDLGEVGMKEFFDPSIVLQEKIERLAVLVKKSKHLVVFTGAGISTSSGIPDFRGPKGIWTLQIGASYPVFREIEESCQAVKRPYFCYFREGKDLPQASLPFHRAMPSMTHMALVELEKAGILKFVISQNVDGLHLRSGIPREKLAELHGNSFMETCPSCGAEYIRDFEVETIGLKETSRHCAKANCKRKLRDTVLDWEDALPQREMSSAEKHCKMADLVLCLGTSLQITPACNLPLKSLRGGGKIVIVNLQRTPKDGKASLVIHGLVDRVIAGVMNSLNLQIRPFVRVDFVQIILNKRISADKRFINWTLRVASVHGQKTPLPFVKSIEITFLDEEKYKAAVLEDQPFLLKRRTGREREFEIRLRINFTGGCGCPCAEINIPFDLEVSTETPNYDREAITQSLRDAASRDSTCGRNAICGRKNNAVARSETTTYAIVTNVVTHAKLQKAHEAESTGIGNLKSWTECFGTTIKRKRSRR